MKHRNCDRPLYFTSETMVWHIDGKKKIKL